MVRRSRSTLVVATLITAVAAVSCADTSSDLDGAPLTPTSSVDDTTTSTSVTDGSLPEWGDTTTSTLATGPVPDAINWSAPLIGGGELDMTGFRDRAVMLWFWAPY